MKTGEIRNMTLDELRSQIREAQDSLVNLRINMVTGRLNNPSRIRYLKRDIARLKTVLHEHELNIRNLRGTTSDSEENPKGSSDDKRET
jgi:large subunit ribosomal protein L29